MRQQLDAILFAVLKSETQASLDTERANRFAPLDEKMALMIAKVAPTVICALLSDFLLSIDRKMFGQVRSLADSQPLNTNVLVNKVQIQVDRVLRLCFRNVSLTC